MPHEIDEHTQEWFSEDSVNLHCVLSWNLKDHGDSIGHLKIDFHNGYFFDSNHYGNNRPDRVIAAVRALKNT